MPPKTKRLLFLLLGFACLMTICLFPARPHEQYAPPAERHVIFDRHSDLLPHEGPKSPFAAVPWTRPQEGSSADGPRPPARQFTEPPIPKEKQGPSGHSAAGPRFPHGGEERTAPPPYTRASYRAAGVVWGMVIGVLVAAAAIRLAFRVIPCKRKKHLSESEE